MSVILTHLKHTEALTQCHQGLELLLPRDGWFPKKVVNVVPLNTPQGVIQCGLRSPGVSPGKGKFQVLVLSCRIFCFTHKES